LTHIMKVSARDNNNKVIAKKPLTNVYEINSSMGGWTYGLIDVKCCYNV